MVTVFVANLTRLMHSHLTAFVGPRGLPTGRPFGGGVPVDAPCYLSAGFVWPRLSTVASREASDRDVFGTFQIKGLWRFDRDEAMKVARDLVAHYDNGLTLVAGGTMLRIIRQPAIRSAEQDDGSFAFRVLIPWRASATQRTSHGVGT